MSCTTSLIQNLFSYCLENKLKNFRGASSNYRRTFLHMHFWQICRVLNQNFSPLYIANGPLKLFKSHYWIVRKKITKHFWRGPLRKISLCAVNHKFNYDINIAYNARIPQIHQGVFRKRSLKGNWTIPAWANYIQ